MTSISQALGHPPSPDAELSAIVEKFKNAVLDGYGSREAFPYHNPRDHIACVMKDAEAIMERLRMRRIPFDALVVKAAVWGHDTLFGVDPNVLGFETSEALAAHYSKQLLVKLGAPHHFAHAVAEAIASTAPSLSPSTIEAKILRAADLGNLGGDYETFRKNSELLFAERLNRGIPLSFGEFVNGSLRYLSLYLRERIELTELAADGAGRSHWHTAALRNLCRLWREENPSAPVITIPNGVGREVWRDEYERAHERSVIIEVFPDSMLQVNSRHALTRKDAFTSSDIIMRVPGYPNAAPLPDGVASEVWISTSDEGVIIEAARICADNGRIISSNADDVKAQNASTILGRIGFTQVNRQPAATQAPLSLRSEWCRPG